MSGHGWVTPNADGSVARCGGPALCKVCALEAGRTSTPAAVAQVAAERRGHVARWRREGWTFKQIAVKMLSTYSQLCPDGYDAQAVRADYVAAMQLLGAEPVAVVEVTEDEQGIVMAGGWSMDLPLVSTIRGGIDFDKPRPGPRPGPDASRKKLVRHIDRQASIIEVCHSTIDRLKARIAELTEVKP